MFILKEFFEPSKLSQEEVEQIELLETTILMLGYELTEFGEFVYVEGVFVIYKKRNNLYDIRTNYSEWHDNFSLNKILKLLDLILRGEKIEWNFLKLTNN